MKKKIFNIAIILLAFFSVFSFAIKVQGVESIKNQIASLNYWWILLAVACMGIYWLLESLNLYEATACIYEKHSFFDSLQVSMIGQFFNAITPFSSGGQPMQMYYMGKKGIDIGRAGSILMVKFIIYQFTLNVYVFLVLLFKFREFMAYQAGLLTLALFGFTINLSVIVFLLLFSYNRKWTEKVLYICLKVLHFLKIVKNIEETKEKTVKEVMLFHSNFHLLKNNVKKMLKIVVYVVLQLSFLFAIPYFIYRAFNLNSESLISLFIINVFLITAMSFIPLPGSSFGAEAGFMTFFGPAFGNNVALATFIWRAITYYSCILVGCLFFIKNRNKSDLKLKDALETGEDKV